MVDVDKVPHQVEVKFDDTDFDYSLAQPSGEDVRFLDANGTPCSYWIENWNNNGNSVIWVKLPDAGTQEFFMYYGDPLAEPMSSGNDTFDFFDDFWFADPTKFSYGTAYGGNPAMLYDVNNGMLREWSSNTWRNLVMHKTFGPTDTCIIRTKFQSDMETSWHHNYLVQDGDISMVCESVEQSGDTGSVWKNGVPVLEC